MAEYFQRTEEKMKRSVKKLFALSGALLTLFVLWTAAVCFIDVQPIGPDGSSVGLAALNAAFQKTLGVNMTLYEITDWLGIVPLCFVCGFALLGLVQLIKRKSFRRVDPDILVLGAFYKAVFAAYIAFEAFFSELSSRAYRRTAGGLVSFVHHIACDVRHPHRNDAA